MYVCLYVCACTPVAAIASAPVTLAASIHRVLRSLSAGGLPTLDMTYSTALGRGRMGGEGDLAGVDGGGVIAGRRSGNREHPLGQVDARRVDAGVDAVGGEVAGHGVGGSGFRLGGWGASDYVAVPVNEAQDDVSARGDGGRGVEGGGGGGGGGGGLHD